MPAEQSAHYPQNSLTRLIDAHHLFLTEKLHEVFPTAFQAPVGSFAHLLALTHTHLWNALSHDDPAFRQEKLRLQGLLRFTNPTTLNYEYPSHVTTSCLRRMLPSLSASEPYLWTCVPAQGVDQVARVLDYFFSFPDRIEGPRTPFAFWRYRVNEILAEDDLQPTDPREIEMRKKGYPFHEALRTEQGKQWWLRYSAARKIYAITV